MLRLGLASAWLTHSCPHILDAASISRLTFAQIRTLQLRLTTATAKKSSCIMRLKWMYDRALCYAVLRIDRVRPGWDPMRVEGHSGQNFCCLLITFLADNGQSYPHGLGYRVQLELLNA